MLALAVSSRSSFADDMLEPCSTDGVVGHGCPYGLWGDALEAPYMAVGVGFKVRRLPRRPTTSTIARNAEGSAVTTGGSAVAPLGSDTSYTLSETLDIHVNRILHVGLEFEISPSVHKTLAPGQRAMAAGAALLLGLRDGGSSLTFGVELAAGGRVIDSHDVLNGSEAVLEARAHAELWITPWFTVGALVGASLLDRGDWVTGLQLGFHSWSYGGN
jgi:hypothetical protein